MTNKLMDISMDKVQGTCNLKCSYSYNYGNSNCVSSFHWIGFLLSYDDQNNPPVMFNNNKYNINVISISFSPRHTYNNTNVEAEITIFHTPIQNGRYLIVSIPVIKSKEKSKASELLTNIINATINKSPEINEAVNLNEITNFNLNTIVPKKEFYYYHGSQWKNENIIYDIKYAIALDSNTLNKLKNIIGYAGLSQVNNQDPLFYNQYGPNRLSNNDNEIYIDCKPVDKSEEEVQIIKDTSYSLNDLTENFPFLKNIDYTFFLSFFLYSFIVIVLLVAFHFVFKKTSKNAK
jgi:hypothetical protein